ncbi:Zinc finger C2H2 type domain-containing protein [Penicillium ucsense]|uniref:Zinc finger C2H2 type domain-containing protein n=1 Tax=Penicillium ucsense TaxID=2839758 RepID=A0A8J8WMF5_9EURO|nr:Zinc finger C2H2 type domain-containing protein [Penicillium ucsense]KAF7738718.1 Zinc finger C2H2 type domain-containing protein [Penicillium ucsense]
MLNQQDSSHLRTADVNSSEHPGGELDFHSASVNNVVDSDTAFLYDYDQVQGSAVEEEAYNVHGNNYDSTSYSQDNNDASGSMSDWAHYPGSLDAWNMADSGLGDYDLNVTGGLLPEYLNVQSGIAGLSYPTTPPLPPPDYHLMAEQNQPWSSPFLGSGLSLESSVPADSNTQPTSMAKPMNRPVGLPRKRSQYSLTKSRQYSSGYSTPLSPRSRDPMQRWQESPPEDEPASLSAIMRAIDDSRDSSSDQAISMTVPASFRHHRRPASINSSISANSVSSWQSSVSGRSPVASSWNSQSQPAGPKVQKGKRKPKKPSGLDTERVFGCTFCCDTFKNKYDWSRHEKSLHLNLGGWACTPNGGIVSSKFDGRPQCVYCGAEDPTLQHLETHNHFQCTESTHLFRRKDHLVQHLRLVHALDALPPLDDWKIPGPPITSRCGFCDQRLETWDERADHLATHFRQGMTMKDWQGEHDFAPEIAAQVINSLPPYILSWEAGTMVPFRASDKTAQDHLNQLSARVNSMAAQSTPTQMIEPAVPRENDSTLPAVEETMVPLGTFTGILTQHLSRYARQQMSLGIIPTDEMFQQESRRLLYDSEDSWNQSIADNPAWISSFRRQLQVHPGPFEGASLEPSDLVEAEVGE